MNEELQKALAEFVRASMAGLRQGKDFVMAQAPEVIQQLIRWKFWEAMLWTACGVMLLLAVVVLTRKMFRADWWKEACQDGDPRIMAAGGPVVIGFIGLAVIMDNAPIALQIYLAPKVWLLEWALRQAR